MPRALKWLAAGGFYFWTYHTYHPGGVGAIAAEKGLSPGARVVQAAKAWTSRDVGRFARLREA